MGRSLENLDEIFLWEKLRFSLDTSTQRKLYCRGLKDRSQKDICTVTGTNNSITQPLDSRTNWFRFNL